MRWKRHNLPTEERVWAGLTKISDRATITCKLAGCMSCPVVCNPHSATIDGMNIQEHVNYWLDSAKNDLGAAEQLFLSAKYDWCLFIGHLVIEKTLKAYFVYNNDNKIPPKTHNLLKLAEMSGLPLVESQKLFFG